MRERDQLSWARRGGAPSAHPPSFTSLAFWASGFLGFGATVPFTLHSHRSQYNAFGSCSTFTPRCGDTLMANAGAGGILALPL